jgi:quinoprotein dehydrogenase-associated probable ABC transporter substrate-binding protein
LLVLSAVPGARLLAAEAAAQVADGAVLKVCADPNNLPQSDNAGAGYENKLAEALARDLGRKVEYTFFPQRQGFVRQTLRAQDDATRKFKCDVIMGVPKGYELTATTQPYMHSTYALVMPARPELSSVKTAQDLLKVPPATLSKLRIGMFAGSPATDWLLLNNLIGQARMYPSQSGDPAEHPASIIEKDLAAGNIDVAVVWGPVAGFLASRPHSGPKWLSVPFLNDPTIKFDYEIAMGVRFGEKEWKETLDGWIAGHQDIIKQILTSYDVPVADGPVTKLSTTADSSRPPDAR